MVLFFQLTWKLVFKNMDYINKQGNKITKVHITVEMIGSEL